MNTSMNMKISYPLLLLLIGLLSSCNKFPLKITVTEQKIQKVLDKKFPYKKDLVVAKIMAYDPHVHIKGHTIYVDVSFSGGILSKSVEGTLKVAGYIHYKQETKAFYLKDFAIIKLNLSKGEGKQKNRVVSALNKFLPAYLHSFPVYKLNSKKYKQNLARMLLKNIKASEQSLIITLAF